jgi:hypothetical protein
MATSIIHIKYNALQQSAEYQEALKNLVSDISKKCKQAENEATISYAFETALYCFIKDWYGKEVDFVKEKNLGSSIHKFSNKRMDAVYNNLIIEYKHSSKLQSETDIIEAENQTINYLQKHIDSNIEYDAILTDGIKVKFFIVKDKTIKSLPFAQLNTIAVDRIIKSLLFIDKKKLTGSNIAKDFIIEAPNKLSKSLSKTLFLSVRDENIAEKTNMLYVEWRDLFHLSEADKGQNQDIDKRRDELSKIFDCEISNNDFEYKSLFCLQTTYTIIIKLIAYKVLAQIANYDDNIFDNIQNSNSNDVKRFFQQLEDGLTFKNNGIRNLLEGDFFSWYCDNNQWNNDVFEKIKNIIDTLISYEDLKFSSSYEPQDLFKDLYIGIIPKSIRHSFGEYFTPAWLADNVVSRSIATIENPQWKGLDPTCGSGVFVIKMIAKIINDCDSNCLSQKEKKTLLNSVLARAKGIDLNPLSVLTARINYFIAISQLIEYGEEIEIPIYLGDSANLPLKISIDNIECFKYNVPTQKRNIDVVLPTSFVYNKDFAKVMFDLQRLVKAGQQDEIYKKITDKISQDDLTENIKTQIQNLSENLVFLHQNKWDSIWVRIIYNFLSTVKLGKFDIIAGNPPWVKWEFLPQTYAEKIKALCLDKHLFSGSVRTGGISLNICALIANTATIQWLDDKGILAFLMPKTLMTQESYAGFRNFYLDNKKTERLYLQSVDDWSKAGNPFVTVQEKFLTYFFARKIIDYSTGITVTNFEKNRSRNIVDINSKKSYKEVEKDFSIKESYALQLVTNNTGFSFVKNKLQNKFSEIIGDCFYKARSGAEFTPAELYFLEKGCNSKRNGNYVFKNIPLTTAKHKVVPTNFLDLETNYIYPVVKGPNINEFDCKTDNEFVIFPHSWGSKATILYSILDSNSPNLAEYLVNNKDLIQGQSERSKSLANGKEFYSISKVGEYTFVDCLVAFRDNTEMKACVITKVTTPWGEQKMPVCAKHAPYISMTKETKANKKLKIPKVAPRKITLDEAYYIVGILNTNIVKEYIKSSNDSRSFSIDLKIKIPEYNSNDNLFTELSLLSKNAHDSTKNTIKADLNKIEKLYLEICKKY